MRALWTILLCGFALFMAAVLGAGYVLFLRPRTLPVYHFEQKMSNHGEFMATTLSLGDTMYISDITEFPLEMKAAWVGKNRMIGRTQNGMDIYAIPDQDTRNYIMLTTEMFPLEIFRNANLAPIQLSSFDVDEIQIIAPQNIPSSRNKTREPVIIQEVVDTLVRRDGMIKGGQAVRGANLHLNSDHLPGLGYAVSVIVDEQGAVFLMERSASEDWIPAGPEFTSWFLSAGG